MCLASESDRPDSSETGQMNAEHAQQWRFTEHVDGRTVDVLISERGEGLVLEAHVMSRPGSFYRFAERLGEVTDPDEAYRSFVQWLQSNLR